MFGAGIRIASGATYDDTAAGATANRRNRYEDWRALVGRQVALIGETCAREHGGRGTSPDQTTQ